MSTDAQDIKDFEELEKVVLNNIKILRAFLNDPDPDPDFIEEVLEDMTIVSYLTEQDAPHRKAKRRALLKRLVKMVDDLEKEAGDTDIRELPEEGEEAEEDTDEECACGDLRSDHRERGCRICDCTQFQEA